MQSYWEEARGRQKGSGKRAEKWLEHVSNGKKKGEEYGVTYLATLVYFHSQIDSKKNIS